MLRTVNRAGGHWWWLPAALLTGLLALFAVLAPGTVGAPPPFTPVADSYVDVSQPSVNFGASTQLRADDSPVLTAYLRFDPENLGGAVARATLKLWVNSTHSRGYAVSGVKDVTFGETTVNAGNAPPLDATPTGSSGSFSAGTWTQVDVTPLVDGLGPVSFGVTIPESGAVSIASRETGSHAPQLLVETSGSAGDTQAPSGPTTLRTTSVGSTQVGLAWNASTDNVGVTGYRVFRGSTQVGAPSGTSFTDTGLTASTAYSYTVKAADAAGNLSPASAALSVTTSAGSSGGDPVIAAAGDIACDPAAQNFKGGQGSGSSCRQKATSDLLVAAKPAAVLLLGDNQYWCGSLQAFQGSYDASWGRLKSITRPAVGNHEYVTSGSSASFTPTGCNSSNAGAAGYFKYFGSAAAGVNGQGYYSYDVGAWHLIALNAECGFVTGACSASGAQGKWLANDLATHKNRCTLAYWHEPLFSSGGRATSKVLPFWQLLAAAGVDVVLNGHDHIYERFAPQTPGGAANPDGIREFIAGTGGSGHTGIGTAARNSVVRNSSTYGILKLTLHPASYDWSFVPISGGGFTDSGTGTCH